MIRALILSFLLLFSIFQIVVAQIIPAADDYWEEVANSLKNKNKLLSLKSEVVLFGLKAQHAGHTIDYARSLYYKMLIDDARTEDTLYFRNSAFIDSLLLSPMASDELKSVMHLLQGKRLRNFNSRSLKFRKDKYQLKNLPVNYAAYSAAKLDSLIEAHFQKALDVKYAFSQPGKKLIWLSSMPDVFLFNPTITDIVRIEQLTYLIENTGSNVIESAEVAELLELPSADFIKALDSLNDPNNKIHKVIRVYDKWMESSQSDQAKHDFIETLLRQFLFGQQQADTVVQQVYKIYLSRCLKSPVELVKVHSIKLLSLILYQNGMMYASTRAEKYRNLFKEALMLYQENMDLISKYPLLNQSLLELSDVIKKSYLHLTSAGVNLPDKPILLNVSYKNVPTLYYKVTSKNLSYVDSISLPSTNDFNYHAANLKFNSLPAGKYKILFSEKPDPKFWAEKASLSIEVSNLVMLHSDEKLFVLDRATGAPVVGAKIKGFYRKVNGKAITGPDELKATYFSGKEGSVDVNVQKINKVQVSFKGDTIEKFFSVVNQSWNRMEVFNKDDYDDLLDYHDEQLRIHIFTDRSIYRPGQTVFYKAIVLSKNPKTGEMIVFNRKNLKAGLFTNTYARWMKENDPVLFIRDPMKRKTDSIKLSPDSFGSFTGSFKIPVTATTGEWYVDSDFIEVDNLNEGAFRVEEYKRPTFDIQFEKPKKMLLPGDAFSVKLKVKSFSGAVLNNLPINYSVTRRGEIPLLHRVEHNFSNDLIAENKTVTDENGMVTLNIQDSILSKLVLPGDRNWTYTYVIKAMAKDGTGEIVETEENITISNRPVTINLQTVNASDRKSLEPIGVGTSVTNVGTIGKLVNFKIYKIIPGKRRNDKNFFAWPEFSPDQWIHSIEELQMYFPNKIFDSNNQEDERVLVLETSLNTTDSSKLMLDRDVMATGSFEVEASVFENQQLIGFTSRRLEIFDSEAESYPSADPEFVFAKNEFPKAAEHVKFYTGSANGGFAIYHLYYASQNGSGVRFKNKYFYKYENSGLNEFNFQIPPDAVNSLLLTKISVRDNRLHRAEKQFHLPEVQKANPQIFIESYRKLLAPGTDASFTVSIKTRNKNTLAQLMTTIYDASLDKFETHAWKIPERSATAYLNLDQKWPFNINHREEGWLNSWNGDAHFNNNWHQLDQALMGRIPGLSIGDFSNALQEVVAVGYGKQKMSTGSTILGIRGVSSIADYKQPLIILDGKVFQGNLSELNSSVIIEMMVLKNEEAMAIYGARAADGVLVISTKGPIILPAQEIQEPVVKIRKNFNETAFFHPRIYADRKGNYTIKFTIPESVTTWNWKMMAHTRNAQFAYAERSLNSQLMLMVQPHMPRLLYQGDKINLMSRITNMDSIAVQGTITCRIEDAVTGKDLTALVLPSGKNTFSVDGKLSTSKGFFLAVPASQLNPLKIIIKAATASYADAEEHVVPVLSTKVFVNRTFPIDMKAGEEITLKNTGLPKDAEVYGVGLSVREKEQAALLNSLPWLANYSFACSEQTFNKLFAHNMALIIMRDDKQMQLMHKQSKESLLQDSLLLNVVPAASDVMGLPWLQLNQKTASQHKALYELLDTVNAKKMIGAYLNRIFSLQNPDGGISWFDGGKSISYISNYILAGFGMLRKDGWEAEQNQQEKYDTFISNLLSYCSKERENSPNLMNIYTMYAQSFWKDKLEFDGHYSGTFLKSLNTHFLSVSLKPLSEQAMLIITVLRFSPAGEPLRIRALDHLKSIRQLAIEDQQNGLRWKALADNDDLNTTSEETLAFLTEAYMEEGIDKSVKHGIVRWLLSAKQEDNWRTTKGTSAAIRLLKDEKGRVSDPPKVLTLTTEDKTLNVSDDLLTGKTFSFSPSQLKSATTVKNLSATAAKGAVNIYYFTSAQDLDTLNKHLKLIKKMYVLGSGNRWDLIQPDQVLKTGDKVRVTLAINTLQPLQFVYIDDKRSAAFEPVDQRSEYKYQQDISYYCAIRDTGLQLFAERIPSGTSEFSYELTVVREGIFFSAASVLQKMYNPAIVAYSNSHKVIVGDKE